MQWALSHRADPEANALAKRHYTCQSPDSDQFMPPGSCIVLKLSPELAVWGTSWPMSEFVKHAWAGAWVCSIYRDERSKADKELLPNSELIRQAIAATRWHYGDPPMLGMITFIDKSKVPPIKRRGVEVWGYSYTEAGFEPVGKTKGGLLAFQLLPAAMPEAEMPIGAQMALAI